MASEFMDDERRRHVKEREEYLKEAGLRNSILQGLEKKYSDDRGNTYFTLTKEAMWFEAVTWFIEAGLPLHSSDEVKYREIQERTSQTLSSSLA